MEIDTLMIETTRRCNMACKHCLRGEPQNIDMDIKYVDMLFSKVDSIYSLALTGGEPSLVPHIIEQIIESAEQHNVDIGNFYIATNGKQITGDFIIAVADLTAYCDHNEISKIDLSNDTYHDEIEPRNLRLLKSLTFFEQKHSKNDTKPNLIRQGRAYSFGDREVSASSIEVDMVEERVTEGIIYLNCNGEIISGCDWSYEYQDFNIICQVEDFSLETVFEQVY